MKTKITTMGLVVFAVVQFFSFTPAQAELITIAIEATVDTVSDPCGHLEGNISLGDTISGYYTYESTTLDSNPADYVGDYWHYAPPRHIPYFQRIRVYLRSEQRRVLVGNW